VLNCKIEEGAPKGSDTTQIMIDEEKGVVIYHYQWIGPDHIRTIQRDGQTLYIDTSMKITIKDARFIKANDESGAFVITKHDGRFVHAFVTPVPLPAGEFFAFGNVHSGVCSLNPWQK
jgi:hypothetical protein